MYILFLIQSFIPSIKHFEYLNILQNTITSIKNQDNTSQHGIKIVLSDDGSDYLSEFIARDLLIQHLPPEKVQLIKEKYLLDVDEIVCVPESKYFMKADLFNFYLKDRGDFYDLVIFLDDDHNFINNDSLQRFIKHYQNGYNFIVGRYYHHDSWFNTVNNGLYNWGIQGTTYAVGFTALQKMNFFSENVKEWGFAEDYDIFRKAYLGSLNSDIKAIFDGNIITIDNISGRWKYCIKKIGGIEEGIRKFEIEHEISFKKAAIKMQKWMDTEKNNYGLNEFIIQNINLNQYLQITNRSSIVKSSFNYKLDLLRIISLAIYHFLVSIRSKIIRIFLDTNQIEYIKKALNYKSPKLR